MGRKSRYAILLLAATLAGFVSGSFYPSVYGIRGALLGLSLALGIVFINVLSVERLDSGQPPSWRVVIGVSLSCGCLAGLVLNLTTLTIPSEMFMIPTTPRGIPTLLLALLYSIGLHSAYAVRWRFQTRKVLKILGLFLLVGVLCTAGRNFSSENISYENDTIFMIPNERPAHDNSSLPDISELPEIIFGTILGSVFLGNAFALPWGIAVMLCDPAWSFKRW